jgi:hypothetical protein
MAAFLGTDERTLRKAYEEDATVRGYIFKEGGRYVSDHLSLASLNYHLLNRREGWPRKSIQAEKQERQRRGRFSKQ